MTLKTTIELLLKEFSVSSLNVDLKTEIKTVPFPKGLTLEVVKKISKKNDEPSFLLTSREKAFKVLQKMKTPAWAHLSIPFIEYQKIQCYSAPQNKKIKKDLSEVDPNILQTFEKLGISLDEQKRFTNVAVDAVFDSVSIWTTFASKLNKHGVLFCSFGDAVKNYPHLIQKHLGSVVPSSDNFFAALNSSVFSDGSFCYVPKDIECPIEVSTYFRINNEESGQFERTLIIAEDRSKIVYLEGCTAPQSSANQLHAAVVELIAFERASIHYSTVQNWYSGDKDGKGGVFNFVTKRGLCQGKESKIFWTQVEVGSAITWKYPSCILSGEGSVGEFHSVALTNNYQQADTGTKMIHRGSNTRSKIVSKGISMGYSKNTYRGLVKVLPKASNTKSYSQCDSLLIGEHATANTLPYFEVQNNFTDLAHEASTSRLSQEQLFYLLQRGIKKEEAIALLVSGFCKEVLNDIPFEFAAEINQLLSLKLEENAG